LVIPFHWGTASTSTGDNEISPAARATTLLTRKIPAVEGDDSKGEYRVNEFKLWEEYTNLTKDIPEITQLSSIFRDVFGTNNNSTNQPNSTQETSVWQSKILRLTPNALQWIFEQPMMWTSRTEDELHSISFKI